MSQALALEARTSTYEHYRGMILHLVRLARRKYRLDHYEALSTANFGFVKAFESFDESRASFSTHLYHTVLREFQTERRNEYRRGEVIPTVDDGDDEITQIGVVSDGFGFVDMIDELGDSGRRIVQLLMEPPIPVRAALQSSKQNAPSRIRSAIFNALDDMGWAADQITEGFTEISNALS